MSVVPIWANNLTELVYLLSVGCAYLCKEAIGQKNTVLHRSPRQLQEQRTGQEHVGGYLHIENTTTRNYVNSTSDECGGTIRVAAGETVEITSPGYPANLPPGFVYCDWKLIADRVTHRISIEFLLIDLPPPRNGGQCVDGFIAYGGFDWSGRQVVNGAKVCGDGGPKLRRFLSRTEMAWLSMVLTDRSRQRGVEYVGLLVEVHLIDADFLLSHLLIGLCSALLIIATCCIPCLRYGWKRRHKESEYETQRRLFQTQSAIRQRLEFINAKYCRDQLRTLANGARVPEVDSEECAEKAFERNGRHRSSLRKMMIMAREYRHHLPYRQVGEDFGGSCRFIVGSSDEEEPHREPEEVVKFVPPAPVPTAIKTVPLSIGHGHRVVHVAPEETDGVAPSIERCRPGSWRRRGVRGGRRHSKVLTDIQELVQAMVSPRIHQPQLHQPQQEEQQAAGHFQNDQLQVALRPVGQLASDGQDFDAGTEIDQPVQRDDPVRPPTEQLLLPVTASMLPVDSDKRMSIGSVGNEYSFMRPGGQHMCSTPQDDVDVTDDDVPRVVADFGDNLERCMTDHRDLNNVSLSSRHRPCPSTVNDDQRSEKSLERPSNEPSTSDRCPRRSTSPAGQHNECSSSGGSNGIPLLEPICEVDDEAFDDDDDQLEFVVDEKLSELALPPQDADRYRDRKFSEANVLLGCSNYEDASKTDHVDCDLKKCLRFDEFDAAASALPPPITQFGRSAFVKRDDKCGRRWSGGRHVSFSVGEGEDSTELTSVSALGSNTEFSALTPGSSSATSSATDDSATKQVLMSCQLTPPEMGVVPSRRQRRPNTPHASVSTGSEDKGQCSSDDVWLQHMKSADHWCRLEHKTALHFVGANKFDNTAETSIWPINNSSLVHQLEDDVAPQSSYIHVYDGYADVADMAEDQVMVGLDGCFDDADLVSNLSTEIDHRRYHTEKQLSDKLDSNDIVVSSNPTEVQRSSMDDDDARQSTSHRPLDGGSCSRRHLSVDQVGGQRTLDSGEVAVGGKAAAREPPLVAEREWDSAVSKAQCGPGLMAEIVNSRRTTYKRSFLNRIDDLLPPALPHRLLGQQFKDTSACGRPVTAAAATSNVSPVDVLGSTRSWKTVPVVLSSSSPSSSTAPEEQGSRRVPTSTRTTAVDISSGTASRRGGGGRRKVSFVSESQF